MAVTIHQLTKWKQTGRSIISLTAWDYSMAQILDRAGVDLILVGDSLAMVGLGYS
ncbi:MAG: 3-methyl-2-oxobutanoate hydroxymethyltransferase, partial [Pleurocapsa sp.]